MQCPPPACSTYVSQTASTYHVRGTLPYCATQATLNATDFKGVPWQVCPGSTQAGLPTQRFTAALDDLHTLQHQHSTRSAKLLNTLQRKPKHSKPQCASRADCYAELLERVELYAQRTSCVQRTTSRCQASASHWQQLGPAWPCMYSVQAVCDVLPLAATAALTGCS